MMRTVISCACDTQNLRRVKSANYHLGTDSCQLLHGLALVF